jgi:hypothetical protein
LEAAVPAVRLSLDQRAAIKATLPTPVNSARFLRQSGDPRDAILRDVEAILTDHRRLGRVDADNTVPAKEIRGAITKLQNAIAALTMAMETTDHVLNDVLSDVVPLQFASGRRWGLPLTDNIRDLRSQLAIVNDGLDLRQQADLPVYAEGARGKGAARELFLSLSTTYSGQYPAPSTTQGSTRRAILARARYYRQREAFVSVAAAVVGTKVSNDDRKYLRRIVPIPQLDDSSG